MSEHIHRLASTCLRNERTVWVLAPEGGGAPVRDLVVFLDGELYREWLWAVPMTQGLVASGAVDPAWFVFVSNQSVEARWRECPCYPPFAEFIAGELLPALEQWYPEIAQVRRRTLVGLSYTGLAAAFVAKERPGVFSRVISQSGSFWSNDCWLAEECRKLAAPLPTAFWLEVGTRETQTNLQHRPDVLQVVSQIEGVRRFRDSLRETGHTVEYHEFDGGHEAAAWARTLPGALTWALGRG